MDGADPILYLVYVDIDVAGHPEPSPDLVELAPGLYLSESHRTRSQVYHAIKWRFAPRRLLVAPLADDPKFKGMEPGVLAWLRRRAAERQSCTCCCLEPRSRCPLLIHAIRWTRSTAGRGRCWHSRGCGSCGASE